VNRFAPQAVVFLASLLALASCGDGGGAILTPGGDDDDDPVDCTDATCGEVRISLTDADGDFLSYTVDVVSIKLEDEDGDLIEALPTRQRVDFVQLGDVSELASVADVPVGNYVGATVRLDFREADVSVEVDGVPAATEVVDANGDALEVVDVEIVFDEAKPLVVATASAALLQVDFDLEASHEVNLGTTPLTATAAPFVVATIEPLDAREFRVRGPIVSVDETGGRYVVELRPFFHRTAENGEFTVETSDETACEINGDESAGEDCLAALADLPADTLTAAQGEYDAAARRFTAARVLAGSSVPGARSDTVLGVVAARDLDVLTLQGGTVVREDGEVVYARGGIQVELGAGTDVTRDGGSTAPLNIDDISVGQRIQAFGSASSSDFAPVLDARGAQVRMQRTRVTGFVVGAVTGELRLDLVSIDGRDPQFFDFDRTGTSLITEANPNDYQVDTGTFDTRDFDDGDGAAAVGFVAPFGSAPPDFIADEVTDFEELRALLALGWGSGGTAAPFLSMGRNGFVVDVNNVSLGERQRLEIGPAVFDINSDLPQPIEVEPIDSGPAIYAVAREGRVEVFSDFEDYAGRVNSLLNGGWDMQALTARGVYDVPSVTLTADFVAISFVSR